MPLAAFVARGNPIADLRYHEAARLVWVCLMTSALICDDWSNALSIWGGIGGGWIALGLVVMDR